MKSAVLSKVSVELKKDGNIELVYSTLPVNEFKDVMDNGLPDSENTELICSFMRRLENVTEKYMNDIRKTI